MRLTRVHLCFLGLFLFALSSVLSFFLFSRLSLISPVTQITPPPFSSPAWPPPVSIAPPAQVYNFLLLGQGDPSHPGASLTDTLIVVHLDLENRRLGLISVPRDTWYAHRKINAAYLRGGFDQVKQAVTTVTDLPIHYVIAVEFHQLIQLVDQLGGLTVNSPHAFDDYFYPIRGRELEICGKTPEEVARLSATLSGFLLEKNFPCRYEHLHFAAGEQKMTGEIVLKFVRSRHSDQYGSDFARAARQQAVLIALKDKLLSLKALENLPHLFPQLAKLVKTDFDLAAAQTLAKLIIDPARYQITKLVLSDENAFNSAKSTDGQFILIPKAGDNHWSAIHRLIQSSLKPKAETPLE
jgi:anionic cell wall polymer biosynthesis LytR-Cps2A-Psr (LCP) family protein